MSRWSWVFKAGFWTSLTGRRPLVSARAPGWVPFPPTLVTSPTQPAPAAAPTEETIGDWHQIQLVEPALIAHELSQLTEQFIKPDLSEFYQEISLNSDAEDPPPLVADTTLAFEVTLFSETENSKDAVIIVDIPANQSPISDEAAAIMREYEAAGLSIKKERASWIAHDRRLARQRAEKIVPIIEEHAEKLSERFDILVTKDHYGHTDFRRWNRERDYFITRIILPKFGRFVKKNSDDWFAIEDAIDGVLERYHDALSDAEEARIAAADDAMFDVPPEPEVQHRSKPSKPKRSKTRNASDASSK